MKKQFLAAAIAAFAISNASHVQAQTDNWPSRPVRFLSDSAAGGANDVTTRLIAEQLTQIWKQQVITVNQPGATGGIATRAASQLEPDGYNFFVPAASAFLALKGAPGVSPNLPIVLPRDFSPVAFLTLAPMFIGVSHHLGVKTLPQLVALAKEKPNTISFAATGRGRITHLTMELLQARAGIGLIFVPYSGGPASAMQDVTAGRIGIVLEGFAGVGAAIESNMIQGIAVATPKRLKEFPDLPTVAESYPGFFAGGWTVLVAPNGTPPALIKRIADDIYKIQENPDFIARHGKLGVYFNKMTADEMLKFAASEQETWRPILEKLAASEGK